MFSRMIVLYGTLVVLAMRASSAPESESAQGVQEYPASAIDALRVRTVSTQTGMDIGAAVSAATDVEDVDQAAFLGTDEVLILGSLPSRLLAVDVSTGKSRGVAGGAMARVSTSR